MVIREGVHPFDQYIYCPTSQGHVKEFVVPGSGRFSLDTQVLGPLPLVNHFLQRLRLAELLERHVPHYDRRLRLAPSLALGVLVRTSCSTANPSTPSAKLVCVPGSDSIRTTSSR
jgi:hypothetical protein